MEVMLAFSLMTIFTITTFTFNASMQELHSWSLNALDNLKKNIEDIDVLVNSGFTNIDNIHVSLFGNDTKIFSSGSISLAHSDYKNAWGRDSCYPDIVLSESNPVYFSEGIDIGVSNISSDIEVRNGVVYLTADSALSSEHDLFIIDARDLLDLKIISSINTGPGISSIEVAGPYIFLAQSSTVNQLQIIDISDRENPYLISQIKLPLPTATTTAPFAVSVFYSKGYVYLGTTKWNGPEFSIIDVSDTYNPVVIGTFETNTLINDIYVRDDMAYIATSDNEQMQVLDISNKSNPVLVYSFSPTGWQTQAGKTLSYFEGNLGLGRTVGGFNVTTNHEAFIFSTEPDTEISFSKDVPGGVYGMLMRNKMIFLLTHFDSEEFQIFNEELTEKMYTLDLDAKPPRMTCDKSDIYFATGNSKGLSILKLYE